MRRGKVDTVGIIDLKEPNLRTLICTTNWEAKTAEILGLVGVISSPYSAMTKLKFCNTIYTCFRPDNDVETIVGRADGKILVAVKCEHCLVVGLKDLDAPGSCLYEVTELSKHLRLKGF